MWQACGYRYCPPCRSLTNPQRRSGPRKGNCSSKRSGLSKEYREKGEGLLSSRQLRDLPTVSSGGCSFIVNVAIRGERPTWLLGAVAFIQGIELARIKALDRSAWRSRLTHQSTQFSGGVSVRLLVYIKCRTWHTSATFCDKFTCTGK